MKGDKIQKLVCPDCRRLLRFKGNGRYECLNKQCAVMDVKADNHHIPPVIIRVKRATVLMNNPVSPFFSGICPTCGRIVERVETAFAVCIGGRKDKHAPIEIELKRGVIEKMAKGKKVEE